MAAATVYVRLFVCLFVFAQSGTFRLYCVRNSKTGTKRVCTLKVYSDSRLKNCRSVAAIGDSLPAFSVLQSHRHGAQRSAAVLCHPISMIGSSLSLSLSLSVVAAGSLALSLSFCVCGSVCTRVLAFVSVYVLCLQP